MKFKKTLLITGTLALSFSLMGSASAKTNSEKVEDIQIKASDIQLYSTLPSTPDKEKEKALIEHKDAIELVEHQLSKDGIALKTDIDNVEYQQYVLSLGTAFELFSSEDMSKIVEYVKFIDWYENYGLNEQLKTYQNQLNNNVKLSSAELIDLNGLLPIPSDAPSTSNNETTINEASLDSTTEIDTLAVSANGYNNITARDYAYSWWNKRNPTYSTYYAEKNGCDVANSSCWAKWNDCTNFVSQALYAGGMKFRTGSSYTSNDAWQFGPLVPTYTWGGAQNFYNHWSKRAGVASAVTALQTGDAVNADFGADGSINHTAIITKNTGNSASNKYLTQHTTDKKETSTLQDWYNAGYKVYGYEIDKASN
ncbi:hypothetical protein J45TS6_25040 [Paenibacillus sp. J45TS6]|uniref:amidase domain-containing protein n=1 Tax=unclassified Paenibacillus TaxID=185978 RepID=UPI001B1C477B|nr:amidase domain-containing protein [Paenibacillus sp. J45TS6]GIP44045.1 hypothetical protein J45TS6_25040 [Paenibacillus sp. J45TS6]